jgi:transposase-like protein
MRGRREKPGGDKLFTFTRLPVEQRKSARTSNAIERLHLEFKRRIETQTVLPSAETASLCLSHKVTVRGQPASRRNWVTSRHGDGLGGTTNVIL